MNPSFRTELNFNWKLFKSTVRVMIHAFIEKIYFIAQPNELRVIIKVTNLWQKVFVCPLGAMHFMWPICLALNNIITLNIVTSEIFKAN